MGAKENVLKIKVGTVRNLSRTISEHGHLNMGADTRVALFLIPDGRRMTAKQMAYIEGYEQGVQDIIEYMRGVK